MNVDESARIVARIGRLWRVHDETERKRLLMLDLQKYDYDAANDAIDRLLREAKSAAAPSIDDIIGFIRSTATIERETGLCRICSNSGWYFVDETGHGTVMRCECEGRFEQKIEDSNLTSEGFVIASADEKREAIIRGFKRFKPDASEHQVAEHVQTFGLKFGLDDDEPF